MQTGQIGNMSPVILSFSCKHYTAISKNKIARREKITDVGARTLLFFFFFFLHFRLDADVLDFFFMYEQHHGICFNFFALLSWGLWFSGPNLSSDDALDTPLCFKGGLVSLGLPLLCVSTESVLIHA